MLMQCPISLSPSPIVGGFFSLTLPEQNFLRIVLTHPTVKYEVSVGLFVFFSLFAFIPLLFDFLFCCIYYINYLSFNFTSIIILIFLQENSN